MPYSKKAGFLATCALFCMGSAFADVTSNPEAVQNLLNRIGGNGTSDRIATVLNTDSSDGNETFTITSKDGKPCVEGTTLSALTTGIGWYLNHYANVNLAWNNLTTDLTGVTLPVPDTTETHTCNADYRYYLNYCTFSYSLSTWTWDRWQEEIDWMALHGINMPLQIVGLETVWRDLLINEYNYSEDEANDFVAGPCFMAWFGMNNLEGWGGPNPDWWYDRQKELGQKINERMRSLGMDPVLPGFAGMVPSNFTEKTGNAALAQGNWCGFKRPYILDPTTDTFAEVAAKYYTHLADVMGTSTYYSIDPFHEGADISSISSKIDDAYAAIYKAMNTAVPDSKWVIQQWQWASYQYKVLDNVPVGKLIVLDLFADGSPRLNQFGNHDVVYSTIFNFGGRTGLMGRFNGVIDGYFNNKANISTIKGIGAAPEAIEQVPVLYDLLFELPWHDTKPNAQTWMANYAKIRYGGVNNDKAAAAWETLRTSALNCTSSLQGPHEAVMCARPAWSVDKVSSWGGSTIFYDQNELISAARNFIEANIENNTNYDYDLVDITRQVMSDYSKTLLANLKSGSSDEVNAARQQTWLGMMDDVDELLGTNANFMLGKWTTMARNIADESSSATDSDRDWLELKNARTLITTWGDRTNSEGSNGLRDYSYRQWNGMLKDFYKPRWEKFFNGESVDWFTNDWNWAHNTETARTYTAEPTGVSRDIANKLMSKYILTWNGNNLYAATSLTDATTFTAYRGADFTAPLTADDAATTYTISIDLNGDGEYGDGETTTGITFAVPATALTGTTTGKIVGNDGTEVTFNVEIRDEVTTARTVTVAVDDAEHGTVSIDGTTDASITGTADVTVTARTKVGYEFDYWTIDEGNGVTNTSSANPYTYSGAAAATITAVYKVRPAIKCADWVFNYEYVNEDLGQIILSELQSAGTETNLDLNNLELEGDQTLVAIDPSVFKGNTVLKSLTIPESVIDLDNYARTHFEGDGTNPSIISIARSVPSGSSWSATISVTNDGSSLNEWGSGLLATGEKPLDNTYYNGIQFYLKAEQFLVVKTGASETNFFAGSKLGTSFTIKMIYDASSKNFTVSVTNVDGTTESKTWTDYTFNEITQFSCAIPKGVNIDMLYISDLTLSSNPFCGCTSLTDFIVDDGNTYYSTVDGKLSNKAGTELLAFPEGRWFTRAFRLATTDGDSAEKVAYTAPTTTLDSDNINDWSNRKVLFDTELNQPGSSLWQMYYSGSNLKIKNINADRNMGGKAGDHSNVEVCIEMWSGNYAYTSWIESAADFQVGMNLNIGSDNVYWDQNASNPLALGSGKTSFTIEEVNTIDIQLNSDGYATVALPLAVQLPADDTTATINAITGVENSKLVLSDMGNDVIAAKTPFVVKGEAHGVVTLNVVYDAIATQSDDANQLLATSVNKLISAGVYVLDGAGMTKTTEQTTIAANTAYLPASFSTESTLLFPTDISTGISEIFDETATRVDLFDLSGRRVNGTPRTGIYITSDGKKLVIK